MPAPTFVAEHEIASWTATTTPRSVTFTPGNGNILVALGGTEQDDTLTISGGVTWTTQQAITGNATSFGSTYCWSGVGAGSSISPTVTRTNIGSFSDAWGFNVLEFSASGGIGASNSTGRTAATGTHITLSLTTTQDNSAIAVMINDWNGASGSGRTWDTLNGITPSAGNGMELTYNFDSGVYTTYIAYYSDAGTAGPKTVGLTVGSAMSAAMIAVEITGTVPVPIGATVAWLV